MNSPEQFVGIILREKLSGSFINDVYSIYSGEVVALFPSIEIPFTVLTVGNNGFLVDFDGIELFPNYFKTTTDLYSWTLEPVIHNSVSSHLNLEEVLL